MSAWAGTTRPRRRAAYMVDYVRKAQSRDWNGVEKSIMIHFSRLSTQTWSSRAFTVFTRLKIVLAVLA